MSEDFRQPFLQVAATAWAGDAGADPSRALGKRPDPGAQGGASAFSVGPLFRGGPWNGVIPSPRLRRQEGEPQLLRLCLAVAFSFDRWAPSKVGLLHLSFKNEFL